MANSILSISDGATIAYNLSGNYEIAEIHTPYGSRTVSLEVKGLDSLPSALKRLAEMGHDLSASLEALQQAVDAQARRKALDEAVAGLKGE